MKEKDVEITQQDFDLWKENPVTKEVFKEIEETKSYHLIVLLNGAPAPDNIHPLVSYGQTIGRINGYDDLLNISFNHLDLKRSELAKEDN